MEPVGVRESQERMLSILSEIDRICKKHGIRYWLDYGTLLGAVRHKGFIPWDDDLDISMYRTDYNKFIEIAQLELGEAFKLQIPTTDEEAELAYAKVRDLNSNIESKNNKGKYRGLFIDVFPYDDATVENVKLQKKATKTVLKKWFGDLEFKKPLFKNITKNIGIGVCKIYKITYIFNPFRKKILKIYEIGKNAEVSDEQDNLIVGIEAPFKGTVHKSDIFPISEIEFEGCMYPVPNNYKGILEYFYGDWERLPEEKDRVPSHSEEIYINIE